MPSLGAILVMAVALCAGCGGLPSAVSPAASQSAPASRQPATGSPPERMALPSGFPVLEGAVQAALPADDPGLIAAWTSDHRGSGAYDFYAASLPGAGYPIVGLYPGGEVAVIRFRVPGGTIWQMVLHGGATGRATIEIRVDRP